MSASFDVCPFYNVIYLDGSLLCLFFIIYLQWVLVASYLVICRQPKEQHLMSCTGGDRGRGPSLPAGRQDICGEEHRDTDSNQCSDRISKEVPVFGYKHTDVDSYALKVFHKAQCIAVDSWRNIRYECGTSLAPFWQLWSSTLGRATTKLTANISMLKNKNNSANMLMLSCYTCYSDCIDLSCWHANNRVVINIHPVETLSVWVTFYYIRIHFLFMYNCKKKRVLYSWPVIFQNQNVP